MCFLWACVDARLSFEVGALDRKIVGIAGLVKWIKECDRLRAEISTAVIRSDATPSATNCGCVELMRNISTQQSEAV